MKTCKDCYYNRTGFDVCFEDRTMFDNDDYVDDNIDVSVDCKGYKPKLKGKDNINEKKVYTRKQVIDALFENPKRKFSMVKDIRGLSVVSPDPKFSIEICVKNALIKQESIHTGVLSTFLPFVKNDQSEFEEIEVERKLKRMSFGEMYYRHFNIGDDKRCSEIKSCVTGLDFSRTDDDISKEEYLGEWTIDGVFEDD